MALGNLAIKEDAPKSNAYDDVPYQSFSYPQTHPEHLYTVAKLFGMKDIPDFRRAKILELGCASGGNLLPLACLYPDCEMTGIDLSEEQIREGRQHIENLGLENITLEQKNIMDVTPGFGAFDYIIVHGILSWVPEEVGDKILSICKENLSERGLAVVSYNTLPGWNFVKSLRDMMLYHTERFTDPKEAITQARALLEFLYENAQSEAYKKVIEGERQLLSKVNDSYLFHDHLETINRQFYFHEVAGAMNDKGLQYVGDSAYTAMYVGNMPKGAVEKLQSVGDIVRQEQYMDFITNRRFRTTIMTHQGIELNRALNTENIFDFTLESDIRPQDEKAELKEEMTFVYENGKTLNTRGRPTSALMLEIRNMPQRFTMNELIDAAVKTHKIERNAANKSAIETGLKLALSGAIKLCSEGVNFAREVSKKPKAFDLARYQAAAPNTYIYTNTSGQTVNGDVFTSHILRYLDGKTDLDKLVEKLADHAEKGELTVKKGDQPVTERKALIENLKPAAEGRLKQLAAQRLLVA